MGNMNDIALQMEEFCSACIIKHSGCTGCHITILQADKRIIVNGFTKEIESVESRKKGVCYV